MSQQLLDGVPVVENAAVPLPAHLLLAQGHHVVIMDRDGKLDGVIC